MQTVKVVSELICLALCYSDESCISGVGTYLRGTGLQWCRLVKRCQNLPAQHCVAGVQTVKVVSALPAGHCVTVVKAV